MIFPIPTLELGEERRRHRFRVAAGTERRDEDVGDACLRVDATGVRRRDGPFALGEHPRDGGVVVKRDANVDPSLYRTVARIRGCCCSTGRVVVHARGEVVALGVPPEQEYRGSQGASPAVECLVVGTCGQAVCQDLHRGRRGGAR